MTEELNRPDDIMEEAKRKAANTPNVEVVELNEK